ncbi:hypothetical protein HAX54_036086 [Datura stramonium]|uniref:Uncharacterized protein n=1 Tax=Datura stramonium TaxID=4076 RepID=A0ABS8VK59_DATST|nr:hypothetical protein [Datura stramonium]
MESSRGKRRTGFIKGKLVKSLYRSAAPSSTSTQYGSSSSKMIQPTTASPTNYYSSSSPPRIVYHLQLHNNHQYQPKEKLLPFNPNNINIALSSSSFIVNQEQAAPPQLPKVSYYIIPPQCNGTNSTGDHESIDTKAAHYISCVQERFRSLECTTN